MVGQPPSPPRRPGQARNGLRRNSFNFHVPCGLDGETTAGVTFAICVHSNTVEWSGEQAVRPRLSDVETAHIHLHNVCTDAKKSSPNGADRKPHRRDWFQDPAPRLEIHPRPPLIVCHPCARSGELHHQGTNFRWCNLILTKAWPSLTTGRPRSSSLFNTTPPRRFHSDQVARTGKNGILESPALSH